MGGSQLKQLSKALQSSGLRRDNSSSSKKNKKKNKERSNADPTRRSAKLAEVHAAFNHFDLKHERRKHDNSKQGVVAGKPALARQAGIENVRFSPFSVGCRAIR
jgi:nucleolar protein 14